jgi:hypothetical protein
LSEASFFLRDPIKEVSFLFWFKVIKSFFSHMSLSKAERALAFKAIILLRKPQKAKGTLLPIERVGKATIFIFLLHLTTI